MGRRGRAEDLARADARRGRARGRAHASTSSSAHIGQKPDHLAALEKAVDNIAASLREIDTTLLVLGLGIDAARYERLNWVTPEITTVRDGVDSVHIDWDPRGKEPTPEDAVFALDFVTNSALRAQAAAASQGLPERLADEAPPGPIIGKA